MGVALGLVLRLIDWSGDYRRDRMQLLLDLAVVRVSIIS